MIFLIAVFMHNQLPVIYADLFTCIKIQKKESESIKQIIDVVSEQITSGKTVAIKGLGGYHLMCDALNNKAVKELRKRKHRDLKTFCSNVQGYQCSKKVLFR